MPAIGMGEVYATACGLIWAAAVILFRKSGEKVAPVPLNVFKNAVATMCFVLTVAVLRVDPIPDGATAADWIVVLLSGVLGIGLADSLFFAALNRLGAGRTAIVDCAYSPFILICSLVYLREPVGMGVLVAMVMMLAAILVGAWRPERAESAEARKRLRVGVALGLGAMVLLATGVVLAKPVLLRQDVWWVTAVRITGGMAFLAVHGMMPRHRAETLRCFRPSRLWKVTIPAAVLGSYLAMFLWLLGFKHTLTATAGVLNQLSTIFVLILATIFLKEPLTLRKGVAVALAFAAAVVAMVL